MVSACLALLLLYLALRGLDWGAFLNTLKSVKFAYLPFIVVWTSISFLARAARWRLLLTSEKTISLTSVFRANMVGYLGNNVLPARAGELARTFYLNKTTGVSASFTLATCLVERLLDVAALVLFALLSLLTQNIVSEELERGVKVMAATGFLGLTFILFLPHIHGSIEKLIRNVAGLKESLKTHVLNGLQKFVFGVQSFQSAKQIALFGSLTLFIWSMDGLGVIFLGNALHITISFPQAILLLASLGLSSAIPTTPGYVGIYQFVAVLVLTPFGLSKEQAIALVLASQVLGLLAIAFWSGLALWQYPKLILSPNVQGE